MANDTTLPGTGDVIATDDLTTLNGSASSGVKVQRIKNGWGTEDAYWDVSGAKPMPVTLAGKRNVISRTVGATYRTPGRAGTAGQMLLGISAVTNPVAVERVAVQMYSTVVKAITVAPPLVRLQNCVATSSFQNGQTNRLQKNTDGATPTWTALVDSGTTDGSNATTALSWLAQTNLAVVATVFAPRIITGAGDDYMPPMELIPQGAGSGPIILQAGDCLGVFLDYTLATQNPVTDMWVVQVTLAEFTAVP